MHDGPAVFPAPPPAPLPQETMYKGYRIEVGSYAAGHGWSPRVVVSLQSVSGGWQHTPLYATSSAKFPSRADADRRALDVATEWIDAEAEQRRRAGA